ncbi:MAG: 16S rRNA (adenine(1518)-N(6)/adenine(1519)-N(6))-dimethyltransferase RsmA [Gammaproteobacteria bacterium]|nr:16S rRNA (adenine(1518)-N(6)/adenine(1519)-N(6))-dimethyltransferase RsmA [Gammaproteobacteria bacterium]
MPSSHRPRKRFGQNFLIDRSVLYQIADAVAPQLGDNLLEIGPGQGALTAVLLTRIKHLTAVEIDRDLVAYLQRHFTAAQLTLYSEDILRFNLSRIAQDNAAFRIVGNLPYNITTPLLFHLLASHVAIADMHFMLQREVADRLVATPGSEQYGRLGIMVSYHCQVERLFEVPPEAFSPPPKVTSAVVRLVPHRTPPVALHHLKSLEQVVTTAFSQRRKTVRNSLKNLLNETHFSAANIDPGERPERLSLVQFAALANQLNPGEIS